MTQNTVIQDQKLAFQDPSMPNRDLNILQLNFDQNEVSSIDYLEIQVDGMKISFISLK